MAEEFTEKMKREQVKRLGEILKTGATPEEISESAGISPDTFRKYAKGYQKASDQLLKALETAGKYYAETHGRARSGLAALSEKARGIYQRLVPVVSWARAGEALDRDLSYHDLANQIDELVSTESRDEKAFALIIEGDSMAPEYLPGDRVVFTPQETPRNGDVVVARLAEEGSVYFKRFRRHGPEGKIIRLESVNEAYKTIEHPEVEFRFIYPAFDMRRRIRK